MIPESSQGLSEWLLRALMLVAAQCAEENAEDNDLMILRKHLLLMGTCLLLASNAPQPETTRTCLVLELWVSPWNGVRRDLLQDVGLC